MARLIIFTLALDNKYVCELEKKRLTKQPSIPCPSSALAEEPVGIGPGVGTSFAAEEGRSFLGEDHSNRREKKVSIGFSRYSPFRIVFSCNQENWVALVS